MLKAIAGIAFLFLISWASASGQHVLGSSLLLAQHGAQGQSMTGYRPVRVMYKVPGQTQMKAGRILTFGGVALIAGGALLYSSADPNYMVYSTYTGGTTSGIDPKRIFGAIFCVYGTGVLIPGVILSSKGKKKMNRYYESQQGLSFNVNPTGLSLRMKL